MKSILIVKTSSIGDVIQTFPVLDYLRRRCPDARIDWVVEKASSEVVLAHPQLSNTLVVDTKRWRKSLIANRTEIAAFGRTLREVEYDVLFDLQGNSKSALITLFAKARHKVGYTWKSAPEKTNWLVTSHRYTPPAHLCARTRYLALVQSYFGDTEQFTAQPVELRLSESERQKKELLLTGIPRRPIFMVCFGSRWKNKQLKSETWAQLLKRIDAEINPGFLFIWGSAEEKKQADALQALFPLTSRSVGELTLNLWQALMGEMDGVLAVDSAALHLCATTSAPSFSIFGASSAAFYKPAGEQHVAFQGSCPYGRTFIKRCPILRTCATGACIQDLAAAELFDSFASWWLRVKDQNRYATLPDRSPR